MSSPFDEWFGKRRRGGSWFPDIDEIMREFDRTFQHAFKNFEQQIPKNLVRERKMDDGSIVRETGPIVWGYSVKIGHDGKPDVRRFGNVDAFPNMLGGGVSVKEEREPLVDIIRGIDEVRIVAEVPGVAKESLKVSADESSVTVESVTGEPRYHKKIDLRDQIDPTTARSTYKNGILEVTLKLKGRSSGGVSIPIE